MTPFRTISAFMVLKIIKQGNPMKIRFLEFKPVLVISKERQ